MGRRLGQRMAQTSRTARLVPSYRNRAERYLASSPFFNPPGPIQRPRASPKFIYNGRHAVLQRSTCRARCRRECEVLWVGTAASRVFSSPKDLKRDASMSQAAPDLKKLYEAVLNGDAKAAVEITQSALDAGVDPQQMVSEQMIPAMDEVGRRFECNEYFVPELLIAARAMKGALELLRPQLAEQGVEPTGRVVIGTVKGDLHDIGKGLVAAMLEGGGFDVVDLGVDVPPEKFVAQAKESKAQIIAVSALLTTTMTGMKSVVQAVQEAGIQDDCKVIVGGAPVTQQYADTIGADGYSSNAAGAVALARADRRFCQTRSVVRAHRTRAVSNMASRFSGGTPA